MKIINVTQGSPEWLAWRKTVWSASECAGLMKRSPHATQWQVFAQKIGLINEPDLSKNPLVKRGKSEEDTLRKRWEDSHGGDTLMPYCGVHETHSFLGASFDGISLAKNVPVELKVPHETTYLAIEKEREASEPYKLYWCQVQAQLAVADAKYGWFVVGSPDLTRHPDLEFRIERDEPFIKEWIAVAKEMESLRKKGQEPPKDPARDYYIPQGCDVATWDELAMKISVIKKHIDDRKEILKALEDKAVGLMGPFAIADHHGLRIVCSMSAAPVDYKRLVADKLSDLSDLEAYRGQPSRRRRVTIKEKELIEQRNMPDTSKKDLVRDVRAFLDMPAVNTPAGKTSSPTPGKPLPSKPSPLSGTKQVVSTEYSGWF